VNLFEAGLRIRPFCELLGKAAVICVRPAVIGKAFRIHQRFHPRMHGIQVQAASRKEIFQRLPFCRSLRMEREQYPLRLDVIVLLQPFNTPGTEIAPGSDKIGENF